MLREHRISQEKLKANMGPEVLSALENEELYEIMLNDDGVLWVEGFSGMKEHGRMTAAAATNFINTISSVAERITNFKSPTFGGELWVDLSGNFKLFRFQAFIPPVTKQPVFIIRKPACKVKTLDELIDDEIMTIDQQNKIKKAVVNKKTILVAGGTQSGKTTLSNAILDYLSKACPDERIITIEDTLELNCNVKNKFSLVTTPEITMDRLIYEAMRSRPDRIVVGEVRGKEAHSMTKAFNTGHPGGLCTVHANSTESSLLRLEQLIMEAGVLPVPEAIVEAINMIIFIKKTFKGKKGREITSIVEVGYDKEKGYVYA